jgi:hypothetical protein
MYSIDIRIRTLFHHLIQWLQQRLESVGALATRVRGRFSVDLYCVSITCAHELSTTATKQMIRRAYSDSSNSTWKVTWSSSLTLLTNLEPPSMSTSISELDGLTERTSFKYYFCEP